MRKLILFALLAVCCFGQGQAVRFVGQPGAIPIAVSASGGGSVFTGSTAVTSSFSATPTFSLADVSVKSPTRFEPGAMTANVTAVTFTNKTAGAKFSVVYLEDGTGSRTKSGDPASNTCTISPTASKYTEQFYEVAADGTTVYGVGCVSNDAADTPITVLSGDCTTPGSGSGVVTCPAQYKTLSCQPGLGDGTNAIAAATYLESTCWNKTGVTFTITAIQCFTDNAGSSTLAATNGAGTALLTGAITCSSTIASGTQSGTTTIANNDFIKFTFVADGTSKQTTWVIAGTY